MSQPMQWAGNTLPEPLKGEIRVEQIPIGNARRMLDGTLRVDVAATKARITVRWGGLTPAQRNTLRMLFDAKTVGQLVLPDGQTFTQAAATQNGWQERQQYDVWGDVFYEVTLTFEEV